MKLGEFSKIITHMEKMKYTVEEMKMSKDDKIELFNSKELDKIARKEKDFLYGTQVTEDGTLGNKEVWLRINF